MVIIIIELDRTLSLHKIAQPRQPPWHLLADSLIVYTNHCQYL